jgi:diguanylate cyclase (GGDEF)-like protein
METDANRINISGRQRMLCQKIAKTASNIYTSKTNVEVKENFDELISAKNLLKIQQEGLIYGSESLNLPANNSETLKVMYRNVDHSYQNILKAVSQIEWFVKSSPYNRNSISTSVEIIQENENIFLEQTDKIVSQYEKEAEEKQRNLRILEIAILLAALLVLIIEWRLVFKPTQKTITAAYNEIERNEQYLSMLFDTVPTVTLVFDAITLKVTKYNNVAVKLLREWLNINLDTETEFNDLFKGYEENENMNVKLLNEIVQNGGFSNLEMKLSDKKTILISAKKVKVENRYQYFIVISDITVIKHAATIDSVTQMLNRRSGIEHAEYLFNKLTSSNRALTIGFIDIDGLKSVNDTFGHLEGDFYINTVARTVLESVDNKFKCMRYGGDEILLMGTDIDVDESRRVLEEIEIKLQRFGNSSKKPYEFSISYGISVSNNRTYRDVKDLIEEADDAMYTFKKAKKLVKKLELQV